ncbi:hypothetical protein, partial [Victivallis vadensis]|uniref:hypothetical protein n=1 Tax=Victivallis vadensis TaxID=172901 RepID=UPI002672FC5A
ESGAEAYSRGAGASPSGSALQGLVSRKRQLLLFFMVLAVESDRIPWYVKKITIGEKHHENSR